MLNNTSNPLHVTNIRQEPQKLTATTPVNVVTEKSNSVIPVPQKMQKVTFMTSMDFQNEHFHTIKLPEDHLVLNES